MESLFGYFERPVGAAADMKELEYISALHQSSSTLREDGTISSTDVLCFLRSRYGIAIDTDDALDIVKGLSGTARLPVPTEEENNKKKWFRFPKAARHKDVDVEVGESPEASTTDTSEKPKKWGCCQKHSEEKEHEESTEKEEKEEAAAMQIRELLKNIGKSDARKSWSIQKKRRKHIAKNVADLVRFDLVQLMSLLLIPTLLRLEQERLKEPRPAAAPHSRAQNVPSRRSIVSKLAKAGADTLKLPWLWWQDRLEKRDAAIKQSLRPKPDTLLLDVLKMLLVQLDEEEDKPMSRSTLLGLAAMMQESSTMTKRNHFPELKHAVVSGTLIRDLLRQVGEQEAAQDNLLIDQMVEAAGGRGTILDEWAFARALTSDVHLWPVGSEDDLSTTFSDVYNILPFECNKYAATEDPLLSGPGDDNSWSIANAGDPRRRSICGSQDSSESFHSCIGPVDTAADADGIGEPLWTGKIPPYKPTVSYIDYGADTFRAVRFVVFVYLFDLAASVFAMLLINHFGINQVKCDTHSDNEFKNFGCKLVQVIWNCIVLALVLSIGGISIIAPVSLGNHQFVGLARLIAIASVSLILLISLPLFGIIYVDYTGNSISEFWRTELEKPEYRSALIVFLVSGALLGLEIFLGGVAGKIPRALVRRFAILRCLFLPSDIRRSSSIKRAATHKINALIENAHKIHRHAHRETRGRNTSNIAMLSFHLYGEKKEGCGGFLWTMWRTLWNDQIVTKEGVWIHSKLAVGQCLQVVLTAILVYFWMYGTEEVARSVENERATIMKGTATFPDKQGLYKNLADRHLRVIPQDWMIYYSFYPGGALTFILVALLISVYYPSTVATILKYRSGFLKSLHDPIFAYSRDYVDHSYYNLGNQMYALIGSAAMFFLIFSGLLFLLLWPVSRGFMILVLAWGLGLCITVFTKMQLQNHVRGNYYSGLYRNRPVAANIAHLAFEAWHIGLGGGVLIGRLTQFLLAMAFWIGRIDVPFLSEDVVVFGYRFDTVAVYYSSEILLHEAHRHPFIERLSAMYLMRLKYREHFGSDAGAAWRRIFVLTLMPWLLKYRQGRDDNDLDEDEDPDE